MSKNLKKIIAIALVLGTLCAVGPVSKVNLLTTSAYASDTNDETTLESLKLETSSGTSIKLYSDDSYDSSDKVDSESVEDGEEYYAKTSSSTVNVSIKGPSSKYVRVFKQTGYDDSFSDSAKGKKISSDLSLSEGKNTILVRVYDEEPDDDTVKYGDDDGASDYTVYVKCTSDSSDDSDDSDSSSDDDIYLDSLSVDGNSISLSDSKTEYTYSVSTSTDSATIKARPQDKDEDTVYIDDDEVDSDDNYKKDVDLEKGENDIKVKIEDEDDNEREYTLKITRGDSSSSTTSTTASTSTSTSSTASTTSTATAATTATTALKVNQWVQVSGGWQYNDSTGQAIKNQWFFDRNLGHWYYLGADGIMASNKWIQSGSKWYYLGSTGAMSVSTTVNGYKVGSDGAWIS